MNNNTTTTTTTTTTTIRGNYQLLIKDPEIHSKTWMIKVPKHATVAEVIGRFLLHRGGGYLSQPCLLRMSFSNHDLTEDRNQVLSNIKELPLRGAVIHTMWSVSAGHVSSKCSECKTISELVGTKFISSPNSYSHEKVQIRSSISNESVVKADHTTRRDEMEGKRNNRKLGVRKGLVKETSKFLTLEQQKNCVSNSSAVEIISSLERMVVSCLKTSDNIVDQLEQLSEMKKAGELTDTEYIKAKSKVLD